MKNKTLFDHLNSIYTDKSLDYYDKLTDADKKTYSTYMINRFISMNPDYINIVNLFQTYYNADNRISYLFYSQILPKKKQFNKYIKSNKESKYEKWLIELFSEYYQTSLLEAEYYLDIMTKTDNGKDEILTICKENGIEDKILNKLKL